jgi:hypothetical protein
VPRVIHVLKLSDLARKDHYMVGRYDDAADTFVPAEPNARVTRVNSTNILDEGLRIRGRGRRMNSKVKLVEISMYRK